MPKLDQHCAISKKRTGFDFRELHMWMDAPKDKLGYNHRIRRHLYNEEEEKKIKDYWENKRGKGWGQRAVVEWLFHIALDHLSTAFKKSKSVYGERTFNYIAFGLSKTNYVHLDHDAYSEYGLEEYFKNLKRPAIIDILHRLKDWILRRKHFVNIP
jgi:hypothetical protein